MNKCMIKTRLVQNTIWNTETKTARKRNAVWRGNLTEYECNTDCDQINNTNSPGSDGLTVEV